MTPAADKMAEALRLGREGGPATEAERLLFEEWMRGHCWALSSAWDGKQYIHEAEHEGDVYPPAMHTRRLFAAWRDRAALVAYEAERTQPAASVVVPDDTIDAVSKALRRAWQLGQTYWQQADSESYSQNAKAEKTQALFAALEDETQALLAAPQLSQPNRSHAHDHQQAAP